MTTIEITDPVAVMQAISKLEAKNASLQQEIERLKAENKTLREFCEWDDIDLLESKP